MAKHVAAAESCESLRHKRVTPHTLRHTCAMGMLAAELDVATIALWLGHSNIKSSEIYIHADMTLKEKALARVARPPPPSTATDRPTPSSPSSKPYNYARSKTRNPPPARTISLNPA